MKKGAVNVAEVGTAACNSRTALTVHDDALHPRWATTGAMVNSARVIALACEIDVGSL
jgi:hypothetical protein